MLGKLYLYYTNTILRILFIFVTLNTTHHLNNIILKQNYLYEMDENLTILLNSNKNIASVDVDTYNKIELSNKSALMYEYDIRNVLSATEIFDIEREDNEVYRIYGRIEYLSILNGLKLTYTELNDFFTGATINLLNISEYKTILNSFDFYLVKPSTIAYSITSSNTEYIRYFDVIATPDDFEIYPAGFSNNVFGDQVYAFNFNIDIDVSNYLDSFGFPLTEIFLYAKYKPLSNGYGAPENVMRTNWDLSTGNATYQSLSNNNLNIGDKVYGDLIEYSKTLFYQTQISGQTYQITTTYRQFISENNYDGNHQLVWKYNPFISLNLRYFSEDLYKANTGNTSYEQTTTIPYYATKLDNNGNYVWRTILPQGYIDPLTGIGVDYPFINKRRYLFSTIILDIVPDLNDADTKTAFSRIKFNDPITQNIVPFNDDINNIGKPC